MSNSLLSTAQFGFLPGRSTSTNLLFTDHLIHKELNSGNCVDTILFDISKAFDIQFLILLFYKLLLVHLGLLENCMHGLRLS